MPSHWAYAEEAPRFSKATRFVAFIKGGGGAYTSHAVYRVQPLDSDEEPYEQNRPTENASSDPKRGAVAAATRSIEAVTPGSHLTIVTNDEFIVDALGRGNLFDWQADNWTKSDGKPPHAVDIWMYAAKILKERGVEVTAIHVRQVSDAWKREFETIRKKKHPGQI